MHPPFGQGSDSASGLAPETSAFEAGYEERHTSYRFVPNIEIDIEYPVSVYAENEPLKTVLDRLFAATPYTYSFLNSTTTILLSKRPQEQPAAVSGLVVDAGGRPVVGASVLVAVIMPACSSAVRR